jgi:hypothetical protein
VSKLIRKSSGSHPVTKWAVLILTLVAGLTLSSVRALAQEDPLQQRGRRGPLHPIERLPRTALPARDPDIIPIGPVHPPHRPPKPPERFISAAPRSGWQAERGNEAALRQESWFERLLLACGVRRD